MGTLSTTEPLASVSFHAPSRIFAAGIGLTSLATLLLELALTRLFSVVLFYHFAFLAISIALLGLGAGGVFAYLQKSRLQSFGTRALAGRLCAANAILIPIVLEIILHIPVSLDLSYSNLFKLTILYLASAIPFFFTGLLFAVVFARETGMITHLYGADLLGGALACLAVVPLLNWFGGPNTILFTAALMAASGALWTNNPVARRRLIYGLAFLLLLIGFNRNGSLIDVVYAKGMFRDKAWVEFARWNALSRVEVDKQAGYGKAVVIDADASTYIMNVDPHKWAGTVWEKNLMAAPPALANVLRPQGDYAIIGPGGGVDVLRAVANGSPNVTAIEINPLIANAVMRDRYADYCYHLYERPEVHLQVTDGRSFVRNSGRQFDVIQMTLVDTWASTAAGAFALSENNLYTVDAFREYFEHLKPDGILAITRWEFHEPREALRVVSVATEALHQLGVPNPAHHFFVVSQGNPNTDGIPVVVIAKRGSFTAAEESAVRVHLAHEPSLSALYLPSSPGNNPFSALIASNDPAAFSSNYAYNISPVSDDAPFFFFTLKTGQLFGASESKRGIDWKVNLGVVVLGIVFIISLLAVLSFLVIPLRLRARPTQAARPLLYFVAVGLGYILVEIAFIQRFVLFLGHPTYALTVVVFLLLLSSGAGSIASRRWLTQTTRVCLPFVFLIATLAIAVWGLPYALSALIGVAFPIKLAVSAVMLAPLGFAMGMPFPTGLRALHKTAQDSTAPPEMPITDGEPLFTAENAVEWAWAMNAGSSVLGSVLAIVIALRFGLNATLAAGACAYLLALLLLPTLPAHRQLT